VIGGGPAGLMAAEVAVAAGCRVVVLDRMPSLARKFLMAGRGGLNLTHSEELERFLDRYGTARDWLEPMVRAFPPAALVAWVEGLGQPTFVGSSGRVFPQALKASPQAWAVLELFSLVGSLPAAAEDAATAWFGAKASLVASNLRGPDRPLHLGGVPITQLLFWVPQTGDIGLGVSMFTYQNSVQFGVIADRSVVPDPDELVSITRKEFDRLVFLVLLGGGSLLD